MIEKKNRIRAQKIKLSVVYGKYYKSIRIGSWVTENQIGGECRHNFHVSHALTTTWLQRFPICSACGGAVLLPPSLKGNII